MKKPKAEVTTTTAQTVQNAQHSKAEQDRRIESASLLTRPSLNSAAVMVAYGEPLGVGEDDVGAMMVALGNSLGDVWAGDLKRAEAMLFCQANALQTIFMNLARRATKQQYIKQWDAYLRMALKAQNQCRMTLETLGNLKNPPVVIAKQANINNGGQQQVNNGAPPPTEPPRARARTSKTKTEQNELLEATHGQELDTGATSQASGGHQALEAVGAVNGAAQ